MQLSLTLYGSFAAQAAPPSLRALLRLESGQRFRVKATQQAEILMVKEDVDRVYCTVLDYGLESRAGRAVF